MINKKYFERFIAILLVVVSIFSFQNYVKSSDGTLKIYFLSVGQGDAIFIETPYGNQMLIDGGPDGTVLERLGEIMALDDKNIDIILLTHPDADHLSGLVQVLKNYDVGTIIETGMNCETAVCKVWERAVIEENTEHFISKAGDKISVDEGVILDIFNPIYSVFQQTIPSRNNEGIVLKLSYASSSVLFTADIENKTEFKLFNSGADIKANFLKIAHHGSKTSTTQKLLDIVKPEIAFIEVGKNNRYGHPHPATLNRLDQNKIPYYRTDTDGTVLLTLDGISYTIETHK